jgi:hypothetical protein
MDDPPIGKRMDDPPIGKRIVGKGHALSGYFRNILPNRRNESFFRHSFFMAGTMKTWWGGDVPFATNVSPRWGFLPGHFTVGYNRVTPMGFGWFSNGWMLQICHPYGVLYDPDGHECLVK